MAPVTEAPTSPEVLNSWKEIAGYLSRGVRTVQRWESELGLPVRRPHGRGRSAVIAMRSDLDAWLTSCPVTKRQLSVKPPLTGPSDLISRSRLLRLDMGRASDDLKGAVDRLTINVVRLQRTQSEN